MKCTSCNKFFEVIGNKTRLEILNCLCECPKCVSDICKETKQEQSKVSHNLKKLADCHCVKVEKQGKKRIYAITKTIKPLMKLAQEHVACNCDPCECNPDESDDCECTECNCDPCECK